MHVLLNQAIMSGPGLVGSCMVWAGTVIIELSLAILAIGQWPLDKSNSDMGLRTLNIFPQTLFSKLDRFPFNKLFCISICTIYWGNKLYCCFYYRTCFFFFLVSPPEHGIVIFHYKENSTFLLFVNIEVISAFC